MFLLELDAHPKATQGQLKAWYRTFRAEAEFEDDLVAAIVADSEALRRNGSWLLKHHYEQGQELTAVQWHTIFTHLENVTLNWETQLHLCQTLALNPTLTPETVALIHPFLLEAATHKKPFVRAWAITALHELAKAHASLRADAVRLVQTAVSDPAKSVQARIRNLT